MDRISREKQTAAKMIELYTGRGDGGELLNYVYGRLDHCIFGQSKPICANCPIHCYRPDMRGRIKAVMAATGPKMLYRHPVLALMHFIDMARDMRRSNWKSDPRE